jgi:hypothetical protein
MKIGFSFGMCIRDIVTGLVDINSVAFIITSTNIRSEEHLLLMVQDYVGRSDYLLGLDQEQCHRVALELWNTNRVFQPRAQGMQRHPQPAGAVWADMFPTAPSDNPAVKSAWESYRLLLNMVENVDTDAADHFQLASRGWHRNNGT